MSILGWALSWSAGKALNMAIDQAGVQDIEKKLNTAVRSWAGQLDPKLEYPDELFSWSATHDASEVARNKLSADISAQLNPEIKVWQAALMESYQSVQTRLGEQSHPFFRQNEEAVRDDLEELAQVLHQICAQEEQFFKKAVIRYIDEIADDTKEIKKIAHGTSADVKALEARFDEFQHAILMGLNRLSQERGFPGNQQAIESLLDQSLHLDKDWVNSEQRRVFEDLLQQYNREIKDKRKKFIFNQNVILSMFNLSELKDLIDEWQKHATDPKKLDHLDLIQKSSMAYGCLTQIPKDILSDLKKLDRCPIHDYFFDGYLGRFVEELNYARQSNIDLVAFYGSDTYLFENLARIIRSLQEYLNFSVEDLYFEKEQAKTIDQLPVQFLLVITDQALTLRDPEDADEVLASLPLRKNYRVSKAEVIVYQGQLLIVAFNRQECFYWDPLAGLTETTLYRARDHEEILDVFCDSGVNGESLITVQVGKSLVNFLDFEERSRHELGRALSLCKTQSGFVGMPPSYLTSVGPVLFRISDSFQLHAVLHFETLRELVEKDPKVSSWLKTRKQEGVVSSLYQLQNIRLFNLSHVYQNLIAVRGKILNSGVLILMEISDQAKVLSLVHLEKSTIIAIDAKRSDGDIHICCGYLDRSGLEAMMELLVFRDFQLIRSETINKPRTEQYKLQDILHISYGLEDANYLNEKGTKLIKRSGKQFNEYLFEKDRINYLKFVQSPDLS